MVRNGLVKSNVHVGKQLKILGSHESIEIKISLLDGFKVKIREKIAWVRYNFLLHGLI